MIFKNIITNNLLSVDQLIEISEPYKAVALCIVTNKCIVAQPIFILDCLRNCCASVYRVNSRV